MPKTWTVMAYFAGDNNLSEEMVWGLQEIRDAAEHSGIGSLPGNPVRVVAQFDPRGPHTLTYEFPTRNPGCRLEDCVIRKDEASTILGRVREKIQPTPNQEAAAARHYCRDKYSERIKEIEAELAAVKAETPYELAEQFVANMFRLGHGERERQAQSILARLLAEPLKPSPEDDVKASKILAAHKETHGEDCWQGLRLVGAVRDEITERALDLAKCSDSIWQTMQELSSPLLLEGFIEEQISKIGKPSDCFLVVLSGHGSGAVGDFLSDDYPQSSLSIPKLRQLLERARSAFDGEWHQARRIDILGMDSCMMSMLEVCYEIQESVDYLVGSEGFVLNTGWPYAPILSCVGDAAKAGTGPGGLARKVAEAYREFYEEYEIAGVSTDISVIELGRIGKLEKPTEEGEPANLAQAMSLLATQLTAQLQKIGDLEELQEVAGPEGSPGTAAAVRNAVILAHWSAQSYKGGQYVDVYDLCQQLARFLSRADTVCQKIRSTCQAVMDFVGTAVLQSHYSGPDFQHSHGLSVYFPWSVSEFCPEYAHLRFARETGWKDFLDEYLRVTRRVRRGQGQALVDGVPKEPFRLFTLGDPLKRKAGTDHHAKAGTDHHAKFGTDHHSRAGTDHHAKAGTDHHSKGKAMVRLVENPPDGHYRYDPVEDRYLAPEDGTGVASPNDIERARIE